MAIPTAGAICPSTPLLYRVYGRFWRNKSKPKITYLAIEVFRTKGDFLKMSEQRLVGMHRSKERSHYTVARWQLQLRKYKSAYYDDLFIFQDWRTQKFYFAVILYKRRSLRNSECKLKM